MKTGSAVIPPRQYNTVEAALSPASDVPKFPSAELFSRAALIRKESRQRPTPLSRIKVSEMTESGEAGEGSFG